MKYGFGIQVGTRIQVFLVSLESRARDLMYGHLASRVGRPRIGEM